MMNQDISRVKAPGAVFLKEEESPTRKKRLFHQLHSHRNEGGGGHKSCWIYRVSGGGDTCRLTLVFFFINGLTLAELKNTCKI